MATFVVIPISNNQEEVGAAIASKLPNKFYKLPNDSWLVSFEGTSKQLSDLLGISEGQSGTGLVLNFSAYYGRANPQIWEWIQINQGSA